MASIELRAVEKWYGEVQVIKGVDLAIEEGEFIIFVGPSGCGKSTLLRMIAGLEETSRGQIVIGERDATAEPPARRGLAMVFQSYALYPHMSVRDNMGFSLKAAGVKRPEMDAKVDEAARVLKLRTELLSRIVPFRLGAFHREPRGGSHSGSVVRILLAQAWAERRGGRCRGQ